MIMSHSLSPGRNRRHSIFKQQRRGGNPLVASLSIVSPGLAGSHFTQAQTSTSFQNLEKVRRELLALCEKQSALLIQEVSSSQARVQELEMKLAENERRLQAKELELQGALGGGIDRLLKEELDKRLRVVSDRFAHLQELVVQKVYEVQQNKIQVKQSKASLGLTYSAVKPFNSEALKQATDLKLESIVLKNREFRHYLKNTCAEFAERLKELEQSTAEMFMTVMAIQEKVSDCEVNIVEADRKCSETEKVVVSGLSSLTTQFHSFTNNLSREKHTVRSYDNKAKPIIEHVSPFETEPNRFAASNYEETVVYEKPKAREMDSYRELQERLKKAVRVKRLSTPIEVFLDDQHFIRKIDGAYLFDAEGDIFKTTISEFGRLCSAGLLRSAQE